MNLLLILRGLLLPLYVETFQTHVYYTNLRADFRLKQFDCVFVDYRLPDMEGTALLQVFYDITNDQMPAPFVMLILPSCRTAMPALS